MGMGLVPGCVRSCRTHAVFCPNHGDQAAPVDGLCKFVFNAPFDFEMDWTAKQTIPSS